ncbi:MAG: PHP domain-containing protein [Planctomycetota bacterium]
MRIDLHLHTTCSDGVYSPAEVVKIAITNKLELISFTDHDTDAAYKLIDVNEIKKHLNIIHGVEITANYQDNEVHILGYFGNGTSDKLQDFLNLIQNERVTRINEGMGNLRKHNINLSFAELKEFNKGESIGRNHLANLLVARGYATSIKEAFTLYLKDELNIIPRLLTPVKDVIGIIQENKGVSIWAHPPRKLFDEFLPVFKKWGLQGIEAFNYRKTRALSDYYCETAKKYNLFVTAGSDWHGFDNEIFPDKIFYHENITDEFVNLFERIKIC